MADDESEWKDFERGEIVGLKRTLDSMQFMRIIRQTPSVYGAVKKWDVVSPTTSRGYQVEYQKNLHKLNEDQQEDYIMARLEGREYLEI